MKEIKKCPNCDKEITKKRNKFCSRSCATTYNNTHLKRVYKKYTTIKSEKINTLHNCDYCGDLAHYKLNNGKYCCSKSYQQCPHIKEKNSNGVKAKWNESNSPMKSFSTEAQQNSNKQLIEESLSKAFIQNSIYSNAFIKPRWIKHFNIEYKCDNCGIYEWNNNPITLEMDHIDGNNRNNTPENLRLLCPNCHSQTSNFRGRNINSGYKKVSDETLIEAIKFSKSIRQALIKVGLTPKGANYNRVNKLKAKYGL